MGLGFPFEGTICFQAETGYTTGADTKAFKVSDKVYDVKIEWGNTYKTLRGISAPSVCAYISAPSDWTLHVEWVSQSTTASLATYCIKRNANGDLTSLNFNVGINILGATKSYYTIKGAKCKTLNIKASTGNEVVYTADFSCASVIQATSTTSVVYASIGGAYGTFNKAGVVIAKNTSTTIATIVDSIDVTINNNLQDYWTASSQYKQAAIPGALDVTGTVDVSLDDGGKVFADGIYTNLTNLYFNQNIPLWGKLTLTSAKWDDLIIDVNTSNDIVKTGQKFIAKTAEFTT
jgi:hypothetical protein